MSNFDDVKNFMQTFGQEVKIKAEFPKETIVKLRYDLIKEELNELQNAIKTKNLKEIADALTDILYVTYGAGHAYGIDLDKCFSEVQRSNMSKLGEDKKPIYNKKGKVMKGPKYFKPNLKSKMKKKISFGSKVKIIEKKDNFYKFDNLWIKKKNLKKINYKTKDIFKNINKFVNTKYKWGSKNFAGVDCSGLIQLFFNFNNKFCPRDAKDQIRYFKKKIELENIRKNDLIFWKGHVAVVISKNSLIHAYGPFKKTVKMPINKTIDRIYKTANLKVMGIRRIS